MYLYLSHFYAPRRLDNLKRFINLVRYESMLQRHDLYLFHFIGLVIGMEDKVYKGKEGFAKIIKPLKST